MLRYRFYVNITKNLTTNRNILLKRRESTDSNYQNPALDRLFRVKPAITVEEDNTDENGDISENSNDEEDDFDELSDDPSPNNRIGKQILKLSRTKYKHIQDFSPWFKEKQQEVVSYRTPSQIRRSLKNWMVKYDRELMQKYYDKPLLWRSDDMNSRNADKVIAYGPDETIAYSHYFMPSRYSITKRIFDEIKTLMPKFKPKNIIDFGCGPGTAGAAAKDTWNQGEIKKYTGIDMSKAMIDSAKIMLDNADINATYWSKISEVVKRMSYSDKHERYDLAIISYTLTELSTDSAKRAAIQILFEMLDIGGCLVVIEAGNPQGSHTVRTARSFVLENFSNKPTQTDSTNNKRKKYKTTEDDSQTPIEYILPPLKGLTHLDISARTVAPCTHDKPCPLSTTNFCSFSQKVLSGMIRKASEEKYSYVIIQKIQNNNMSVTKINQEKDNWTFDSQKPQQVTKFNENSSPRDILMEYIRCTDEGDVEQVSEKLLDEVSEYFVVIHSFVYI